MANPVNRQAEASRFERLAKEVDDRELSRYYAERAAELRNAPSPAEVKQELELIKSQVTERVTAQVKGQILADKVKRARAAKATTGNQPYRATDNDVVNESTRRAMLAQSESEESQARQADMRADDARACLLRAPSDLVSFYSAKEQSYRREAEGRRAKAAAHRRAAEAI